MTDQSDSQMLALLRRIDERLGAIRSEMVEIKKRVGFLEGQYGSLSGRVDRLGSSVDQIKRHMDIDPGN